MSKKVDFVKAAIEYLSMNLSVIPVKDKIPTMPWKEFQERRMTKQEARKFFQNAEGIAVVTGKISGITVLDLDDEHYYADIKDKMNAPTVKTKRGYHFYFNYSPTSITSVKLMNLYDVRNNGGYVVVPPTPGYIWIKPLKFPLPEVPVLMKKHHIDETAFRRGRRDNDLFHIALSLVRGGMNRDEAIATLLPYARICQPPMDEKVVIQKVDSAINHAKMQSLDDELEIYLRNIEGRFRLADIYRDLNIVTLADKKKVWAAVDKRVAEGKFRKIGKWSGLYETLEKELTPMDLSQREISFYDLKFPLGLEKLVKIPEKSILVLAGAQNVGKTLFFLNFIAMNMNKHKIHYFNSEMSEDELVYRLGQFPVTKWEFNAYERCRDFENVLKPDEINIIDYYEIYDEFWHVAAFFRNVYEKLGHGLVFVGIQKNPLSLYGRGKTFGLEKPRLYLAMDWNRLVIVKAKIYAREEDMGKLKAINFEINKTELKPTSDWYDISHEELVS